MADNREWRGGGSGVGGVVEKVRKIAWSRFGWVAVAQLNCAHNPKVGGSNPPPQPNFESPRRPVGQIGDKRASRFGFRGLADHLRLLMRVEVVGLYCFSSPPL